MFYSMLETCRSQLSATLIKTTCFGVRSQQQKTGYAPATPAKSECATLRGSPRPSTAEFITSLRANRTLQIVAVQQSDTFTENSILPIGIPQHVAKLDPAQQRERHPKSQARPYNKTDALQSRHSYPPRPRLHSTGVRLRDGYTKSHKI